MRLTDFFLGKRIFSFVLMIILICLGVNSYLNLRVETTPEVNAPVIYVAVPLPGAAPEEVESQITIPVEEKINEIEDIDRIFSHSWQNVSLVVAFFKDSVEPEEKFDEFRNKIDEVKPLLPAEMMDPIIEEISFENLPMMFLGFSGGGKSRYELSKYAAKIKNEIEAVQGVKKVVMTGATDKRVEIALEPKAIQKFGADALRILTSKLNEINTNFPGGKLSLMNKEYNVRTVGKFYDIDDLKRMVVGTYEDKPVRLRNVADVEEMYPDPETIVHVDGIEGVTLSIMKKNGYGTIKVADRVKEVLDKYQDVVIMSDNSETVKSQMGDLRNHSVWGIVLVLLILFITLGFRVAAIVSFAIPISVLMTFTAMYLRGMTLDIVSLFSLLLALGMMVDNSIVVCENIFRHMTLGKDSDSAAIDATNEVSMPILSSTGAVIAAFLPMGYFLTGPIGEFTRPIPIVVTFALLSSLIVANFFNPVLFNTFIKHVRTNKESHDKSKLERAKRFYGRVISWCLDHGSVVMASALALLVVCVMLVAFRVIGLQLFPQLDTSKFYIDIKTPAGSTLDETTSSVKKIEALFQESPYVNNYITNIGSSGTRIEIDDSIYFGSNIARFIVDLKPMSETHKRHKSIIQDFRTRVENLFEDGTRVVFIEKVLGPPVGSPISIQVSGNDYTQMKRMTNGIREMIGKEAGVVDLMDNAPANIPQIILEIKQDALGRYGLTTRDLGGYIFLSLTGYKIGDIVIDNEKKDIFLRIKRGKQEDITAMQSASFTLPGGEKVKLSDLISFKFTDGVSAIDHENGKRTITIEANVAAGFEAQRIVDNLKKKLPELKKQMEARDPEMKSVSVSFAGETMLLSKAMSDLTTAVFVSLILIYLILLVEFKSTTQPLIIMVCVPYALVGVIIGLLIMGYSFSILAGIGLLCLIGIVVNNGIIYIDYANLLQERGLKRRDACIEACMTRVRPIVLTKLTVILGIAPLATAAASKTQFWKPLCWAIIWGLVIATTLTLVIIPVAYYIVEGWRDSYYRKRTPKTGETA
ncbi:MAG TPA: efflux RND transporter permease subunit [bacterium]|nr:efflux RND transporter permease subunit [bacterium]